MGYLNNNFQASKMDIQHILLSITVFLLTTCSFNTYKCGDKYLHVYYGGGVGGYRLVVLNKQESMIFKSIDHYRNYKKNDSPKLIFENDSPIAVSCIEGIRFRTDSKPVVNTLIDSVTIKVVEPHELIDLDSTRFDHIIR